MFKSKHYVPILKWKRAEQNALMALNEKDKKYITPLIQLVMPKASKPKDGTQATQEEQLTDIIQKFRDKIPQIPAEILKCWGKTPTFLDFSLLYSVTLKAESLNNIISEGCKIGLCLIPVVNLSDSPEIQRTVCALAKKNNSGLCLRLVCPDFNEFPTFCKKIESFLTSHRLAEASCDLIVDIKNIEEDDIKYATYMDLCQTIPNLLKWRTFTFASGAFPVDLSKYRIDEENLIPRLDWNSWIYQINNKKLLRKPSFADYTIQYPTYDESAQFFHPTTSIKYTLANDWLIMKGKKQKFSLYLASAKLLAEDKSRFMGEDFSCGDKYISEKGKHFEKYQKHPEIKGTGSTETWLTAGINHHLVYTADQIATLP